ncbi:mu-type opioid receptor [Biomphalaria pfeifferi]|uniref:Mu-type opioid receptor n=1 Tax=Biomphalaria pfeifferi TaxID=112525 RepID=A0AAD8B8U5_BIOPF|nr:mu-type opioid receptor [Biomphalaria pfeifferi]
MEVPWFHAPFVCQTGVFSTYFCSFLSVWLVVMVTLENYIRICHPKMVPTFCTLKMARGVLLIIVVIGVVCYNFPLWTTYSQEIPRGYLCLTMTEYAEYIKILTYVDTALTLVLPLLLNITWMVGIFRALLLARSRNRRLRQSSSRGQVGRSGVSTPYNHVTAMLLAVTLTFIVLHTPSHTIRLRLLIENFLSEDMHRYLSTVRLQGYFELLYYTNFSTNFLIYVASGKCFRELWKKHASSCICRETSCLRPAQKSLHRSQETNVHSLPLLDKPQTSLSRHLLQSSDDVEQKSEV